MTRVYFTGGKDVYQHKSNRVPPYRGQIRADIPAARFLGYEVNRFDGQKRQDRERHGDGFLPLLLQLTPQKDLIIKDSVPLTIDNSTEEAQSASVKKLFARYDVHTVMACRMCDYGSAEMRHTELDVR